VWTWRRKNKKRCNWDKPYYKKKIKGVQGNCSRGKSNEGPVEGRDSRERLHPEGEAGREGTCKTNARKTAVLKRRRKMVPSKKTDQYRAE